MTTIKFRRDTSVNWTSVNPIPAQGEPCYETDTGKLKIGNGSDNYVALPYVSDGGGSSGDLPIATATTLGGIKVGNNLSITEDGTLSANGGSTGTTNYTQLENKPQINSVELTGNKTLDDLGIQAKGNYLTALPDNAVTTDTTQEITGDKTFTKTITTTNITCNDTLMASTIRTKANGTIKLAHPTNNASGMITLDNNYGQFSISSSLTGDNNLLGVTRGTAYARIMGNKIETKDKDGNLYYYINSKNITNCLLEVPQRMKLELNNGTLTLKAGSQVIVPNGFETDGTTPKFDYVTVENDKEFTTGAGDKTLFIHIDGSGVTSTNSNMVVSGVTDSLANTRYHAWYDTTNNIIQRYGSDASIYTQVSLPIAISTFSDGGICSSVDQIFNGMGYMGSTIWVDKGVKGLSAEGRDDSGTWKTNEIATSNVITRTLSGTETCQMALSRNAIDKAFYYYMSEDGFLYNNANVKQSNYISFADLTITDGQITSLQPKLPFRAVDYSDSATVSGWGMPSDKHIDLTLGGSGSTYTAPANGYIYVSGTANATNGGIELVTSQLGTRCVSPTKSSSLMTFIPVMNGDVVNINYTDVGIGLFRFVYAEGSK